ncbi:hypothetical protein G7Z17_g12713 [Cylindrodendrum hubeiense]|uniref:Zn(2)-C6 fungal-type domain-containing protein n=1 Tax=Cylindrodendrum hubeiense TaxID=595255 RepID=A0A9P5L8Z2_9HYPO|nr:hypothetical protein G7Z17_g12713 [Cylindrodendrum hubeiense]
MSTSEPSQNVRRKRSIVPDDRRKRVRKACDPCRANKLKCDGLSPCQRCRAADSACRFAEGRVSVASPSHQHSEKELILEAILRARNIQVPEGLDELRRYAEALEGGDKEGQSIEPEQGRTDGEAMVVERSSSDERERGSIVVDHVLNPQTFVHDQGKTYFDGGSSAWAFFDSVRERVHKPPNPTRDRQTAYQHFIIDPPNLVLNDLRASLLAALPPRGVLDFLSTTFFRYSQSNYFFLHPAIFSRKLDAFLAGTQEFDRQGTYATRRSIEFICVLFMILALGSQYADLEQHGQVQVDSSRLVSDASTLDLSNMTTPTPTPNPGWRFYEVSRRLLSDVASSCSMTSIQACVLQGDFLITTSAHDIAYNAYGLAARMGINMGMHRALGTDALHPHVRELRNRLWWSVYTLERMFTFQMGRPLMIDDEEIDTPFPVDLPELRTPQYSSPLEGQIALIKLCRIMGKIVKTMYSRTTPSGNEHIINTRSFVNLKADLQQWKEELPEKLQLSSEATRGVVHLHMSHEQAIILLSRIPLTHAVASKRTNETPLEHRKIEFLQEAARDCVAAALATIKMLQTLNQRGLICRYSSHDPLYCSASLHVLLLGARLEPPADATKKIIAEGILILRELAKGSETAASSLGCIVPGFQPFFENGAMNSVSQDQSSSDGGRAQGHRAWQEWISNTDDAETSHPGSVGTMTMTPQLQNSLNGHVNTQSNDRVPISGWSDNAGYEDGGFSTAAQNAPQVAGPQVVSPEYQHFGLDNPMNSWTINGQPFWPGDLNANDHPVQPPSGDDLVKGSSVKNQPSDQATGKGAEPSQSAETHETTSLSPTPAPDEISVYPCTQDGKSVMVSSQPCNHAAYPDAYLEVVSGELLGRLEDINHDRLQVARALSIPLSELYFHGPELALRWKGMVSEVMITSKQGRLQGLSMKYLTLPSPEVVDNSKAAGYLTDKDKDDILLLITSMMPRAQHWAAVERMVDGPHHLRATDMAALVTEAEGYMRIELARFATVTREDYSFSNPEEIKSLIRGIPRLLIQAYGITSDLAVEYMVQVDEMTPHIRQQLSHKMGRTIVDIIDVTWKGIAGHDAKQTRAFWDALRPRLEVVANTPLVCCQSVLGDKIKKILQRPHLK